MSLRDESRAAVQAPLGAERAPESSGASLWQHFATARDPQSFFASWLALQCTQIAGSRAGILLVREPDGVFAPAAVWPDRSRDMAYLVPCAETALRERRGAVERPDVAGNGVLAYIGYPVELDGDRAAVVAIDVLARSETALAEAMRQLHWGAGWLEARFRRNRGAQDLENLKSSHFALDTVAIAAEHADTGALARGVATSLATRLEARSVAIGLCEGGGVRLRALSHAATFERNSELITALEVAMEEAADQSASVMEPPAPSGDQAISLAHREFLQIARTGSVLSVPLLSAGKVVGVITVERDEGGAFDPAQIARIESVGALVGPLFALQRQSDRLVSGRLVHYAGRGAKALFGPRRPAVKFFSALVALGIAAMAFLPGTFRVSATAAIEGTVQRAAVAPFDGFVISAPARAGDRVSEGQVLATLDDRELRLEAARWQSERDQHVLRQQEAVGKRERASALISEALIKQAQAQLAFVEARIERARVVAPIAGIVVSGDLSQQLGAPVERGKLLFEIAPLDRYRVILQVDERDAHHVVEGQEGTLIVKGLTDLPVSLRVNKVTPVANVSNGKNTFRIEAEVTDPPAALRPGMEGVAKIAIGERRLLWIWTRSLIDWLRMTWWVWVS